MKKKTAGFTLVELIVVIAILGLLATVSLVSFRGTQIKSRDVQRKNDLAQIQKALELYYNDYKQYPLSIPAGGGSWEDANQTLYMKEVPQDPKFGNYSFSSDGTYYVLYARLENEEDPQFKEELGTNCGGENCNYAVSSPNY
jgi:prepilin-type N-terminal cleavage/methylation domain-containing protein